MFESHLIRACSASGAGCGSVDYCDVAAGGVTFMIGGCRGARGTCMFCAAAAENRHNATNAITIILLVGAFIFPLFSRGNPLSGYTYVAVTQTGIVY
jgi:hypothetical protein